MSKKLLSFVTSFILLIVLLVLPSKAYALNSPEKLSNSANEVVQPAIISDSNGKVHVVWVDNPNASTTSLYHRYWNGQVWSTATVLASGSYHELPGLAADTSGNVHLVWDADTNGGIFQIYYSKWNGTSWTLPVAISGSTPGDTAWDAEVAIDSSGNPHVAFTFIPAGTVGSKRYTYYTKFNGSSWVAPINLTESGTFHQYPTIASDTLGKVHVAWKSDLLGSFAIIHRVWNGSSFSSSASVSGTVPATQDPQPRISVDPANNAHIVWEELDPSIANNYLIKYSKWAGTSWASPFTVSSVGAQTVQGVPSVAIVSGSLNDVLVGWIDKTTTPLKVDFRKFNNSTSSWETARTNNIQQSSADFPVAIIDKWDNIHTAWGERNSTTNNYEIFYDAIPLAVSVIGSSGGSLTTFNNDTLTIPSGSLSQNTIISAQIAPLSQTAPSGNITPPRQYIFEPTGTVFNPALTAVFRYTDAELAGGNENTLGIYVWDSTTSSWVFKTGSINKPQNRLTVQLDHFSIFGLFATNDSVNWLGPLHVDGTNTFNQGLTLPIKFNTGQSTDINQMKVQILDTSANLIQEFLPGQGNNSLRSDGQDKQYLVNLDTKNLNPGTYQVNVLYQGLLKDSIQFTLD